MTSDSCAYYRERAEEHRRLARQSSQANIAGMHLQLAKNYDELCGAAADAAHGGENSGEQGQPAGS